MTNQAADLRTARSVVVRASQDRAFKVFTEDMTRWWPPEHHIGAEAFEAAILEPGVGGRWFERAADGTECQWGRVVAWEPPQRVVLYWQIGTDWAYDPTLTLEVEIRFIAEGPSTTRVELEHRGMEQYGEQAEAMHASFSSEDGWAMTLKRFSAAVEA